MSNVISLPPSSNTGAIVASALPFTMGLGWLQGSYPASAFSVVVARFHDEFGDHVLGRGRFFRSACMEFPGGALLAFDEDEEGGRGVFAIPACVLEGIGSVSNLRNLCGFLHMIGGRASRLDVSGDDYERIVTPWEVHTAGRDRFCVCGFQARKATFVRGAVGYEDRSGDTAYFGKRGNEGSGRCVRIYDKSVESEGKIDAIRWEVEFADEYADGALSFLNSSKSDLDFVRKLAELLAGAIDFREGGGHVDRHLDRRARLPWWQSILDRLGEARRIVVKRVSSTVESQWAWIVRSVAPALKFQHKIQRVREAASGALRSVTCFSERLRLAMDDAFLSARQILELRAEERRLLPF